ncbi:o-succinylbenzoate synthase [Shewanella sp. YIC-542]|uniref:o-succinylbenzoate synthase n=1 Tax=Shewanella mytili TaxID=3377111 RepID=UPI00398E5297
MKIDALTLARYQIPLEAGLPVGKQRIESRQGVVLRACVDGGEHYVEIAPLSGTDRDGQLINGFSRESLDEVIAEAKNLLPSVMNGTHDLQNACHGTALPSLAWGLSLLSAKILGQLPLHHHQFLPVPLLLPREGEPGALLKQRIAALPPAITRLKIKVAQTSMAEELSLIYAVLEQRPTLKLRLDANQGFELAEAESFCACLPKAAIEYVEEPCRRWQDNMTLFSRTGIPFALDETLARNPNEEISAELHTQGLRALVLKPMLLGSLQRLQNLIRHADALGIRTVLSSSLEASLGIHDICRVASWLTPDEAPGVDTLSAFGKTLITGDDPRHNLTFDALTTVFTLEK